MSYIFDANRETPESIARKRQIAEMLAGRASSAPRNVGEGLQAIGNAILYRSMQGKADKAEAAGRDSASNAWANVFGGMGGDFPPAPAAPGASSYAGDTVPMDRASMRVAQAHGAAGGNEAYRNAIASIESGGSYDAVGPAHSKLGRPLGKYQVMEANIGPWTRKHLGREMTPDEFLANSKAQDAVFDGEFGSYVQRFGDPAKAAQAWFAGPGGVGTNRQDSLGTSVPAYAAKFTAALGGPSQAALESLPVGGSMQMAQASPSSDPQNSMTMGAPPVQAGGGMPNAQSLMGLLNNPYLSDAQRQIAGALLQNQMRQQDPSYQLDMDYKRAQLDQLRNPTPKPTDDMREYEFAKSQGFQGTFQDFMIGMKRAGATNVNVGAGEKAWDQESAKLFAKKYDDLASQASNAQQMMGMYDLAEQALDSGVRTGLGADAELTVRQLGAAMGLDTDPQKLAGGELIRAVQNRMALTMRSPDGGMGMPGALSDRDIQFLKDSQVGIDRSPGGNRRMLKAFRAMEQRKIEIAQLADQYVQDNGRLDAGFNRAVREYAEKNPLFGADEPPEPAVTKPLSEMSDEELEAIINGQ